VEIATHNTSDEAIAAIADPVERARALRAIAKRRGTLTAAQSRIYVAAVAELRGDGERERSWIARRLGVSPQWVSSLLGRARKEAAA
jgi:hypothetical protein